MAQKHVVVIGAGVAGLTTALLLSRDPTLKITVAAKHMPGDYDIEYASPWAGANYMPVSKAGTDAAQWDRDTWPPLEDLAKNHPEAGVHFQECVIHTRNKDLSTQSATADWFSELLLPDPWFRQLLPNFRSLSKNEVRPGYDSATCFTSVCINTAIYLPWLVSQCLANGVTFRRAVFRHILDAATTTTTTATAAAAAVGPRTMATTADAIVNCTGLMARTLGGVQDTSVVPARGQIVLVRNETLGMLNVSSTDDGPEEACYVMARAAGGGTILGGSYQKGSWEARVDPDQAVRIMQRAVAMCPQLTRGGGIEKLDIVRHGVGLRPVREGGTRIEKERIGGVWVVHNYGAGGAGYQSSYGCAKAAVALVQEALQDRAKL